MRLIGNWGRRSLTVRSGRRGGGLGGRTEGVIDGCWHCGASAGIVGIASIVGNSCMSYMDRESRCRIVSLLILDRMIGTNESWQQNCYPRCFEKDFTPVWTRLPFQLFVLFLKTR